MDKLQKTIEAMLMKEAGIYSIGVKNLGNCQQLVINRQTMRSASLIKIFIMIEAFSQSRQGKLNFGKHLTVSDAVRVGGAGSLQTAPNGTVKTVYELIRLMIVESDNIATNILIDELHINNINAMIAHLGCTNTVLQRKMMDFASAACGRENYTSVTDMLAVLEKLYRLRCLDKASDQAMLEILKQQEDKCKIPCLLPKCLTVAHKTGELDGAEHDAGIVYGDKTDYLICIMTDQLPDSARGIEVIAAISKAVYDLLD